MKAGILIRHASTYELGLLVRVYEHRMAPGTDFCDVIWDDGEITTHPSRELTADLEFPPWWNGSLGANYLARLQEEAV